MRIAIVGSRDFANLALVRRYVLGLPKDTVIISGGARGVDREAELAAYTAGFQVEIFPANWKELGKAAGFIRNKDIVRSADKVVVFWDGQSNGTRHTMTLAQEADKPLELYICRRAPKGVSDNPGVFKRLPEDFWGKRPEPTGTPTMIAARRRKAKGF